MSKQASVQSVPPHVRPDGTRILNTAVWSFLMGVGSTSLIITGLSWFFRGPK